MQLLKQITDRIRKFNHTVDDYQEKITFSEANVHESKISEPAVEKQHNLVVATHESRFTQEMMQYSIDMAKRMSCGIIAVNAANLTHEITDFFSTTYDELCNDFRDSSQKFVAEFKTLATENEIEFTHAVKFSGIDHAIEDITKEYGHIEFIISENQESQTAQNTVTNENRIAQRLCVYSLN